MYEVSRDSSSKPWLASREWRERATSRALTQRLVPFASSGSALAASSM